MATVTVREQLLQHWEERPGLVASLSSVDHKRIGRRYLVTGFVFFLLGGLEAVVMRAQLMRPDNGVVDPQTYNRLFSMHGTTMIFLFVMPVGAAFMNYLLPLRIGARDVAFPRLNALSWWIFLFGGILLYSTFIFGTSAPPVSPDGVNFGNIAPGGGPGSFNFLADSPDGGWFCYQPNCGPLYSPGTAMDYWSAGLQILGLASLVSAVNFIVTVLNMRAKGMRLLRMPVFAWMTMITAFLTFLILVLF